MITWKEKASMWGMKVAMAIVVGVATVVKPAMNAVFDYKERWRANEDKELFARLKNVFDNADIPLSNIKTLNEMITTNKKPVECHMCGKVKELCDCCNKEMPDTLTNLFKAATDGGLDKHISKALEDLAKRLNGCQCCDCLEDCFCMDCPVHPTYRSKAIITDTPKQDTVCCGCIGTDHCETCPVHGYTPHPKGIYDVVGHDCSQPRINGFLVGDTVDILDGQFVGYKGMVVDIVGEQLDVLPVGVTQKVMLSQSQVKLNPKFAADTVFVANGQPFKGTGEKLKKERARKLVNDMIERKLFDANNPIAVENQVDAIMKWDDFTFESMKRVVAKHNVPVKVEEHRSQLSKEIETVLQENLSKIDVNNKPRTFEELKDVIELQSDMNDLANDILRKQVGEYTDLDRFIEMGEEAQEILNKSQWKQNFDTAFDRVYRNTKAAKQANKKKPANRKSSPANSGVGKNSRKPSAKTKKTTKAKKK